MFICKYFYRAGPMEDLMKFLLRSRFSMNIAFWRIYYAPWVLIKFSDIFNSFKNLLRFNGMEIIYAPFIPISLSYNLKTSKVLFCNRTAAKHLAPSIPKEFFRMEPSKIPRSRHLRWLFLMSSSKTKEIPNSLIILLAILRF